MTPAVSVLMAVRNGGPHLDASIASIAQQTFTDWEMLVVDDASDDGTPQVLAQWAATDPRIRVVTNAANIGQTASLNKGLRECRADWVARQDADDLSDPRRLAAQIRFLENHPDIVLLGTQGILIDEAGKKVGLLDVPGGEAGILWTSMFLNPFLHTSVVFRRVNALEKHGGYDENFRIAQDYDLWVRMLNASPTANLPARLVSYRRSDGSLSRAGRSIAEEEADRVSRRQTQQLLGRALSSEESALCSEFRRGLPVPRRRAFHAMQERLQNEFSTRYPQCSSGPRSSQYRCHLRLAGAGENIMAALPEVVAALSCDPPGTIRWLRERFF
jgi:glycosyltransferase involved in cell wall biosynthesis